MDGAQFTSSPDEENCQSTAFTVTFESAKSGHSKFIKRHIRNLSLPVVNVYDNKVSDLYHVLKWFLLYFMFKYTNLSFYYS